MENLEENLEKISKVADGILEKKGELIEADLNAGFTLKNSSAVIEGVAYALKNFWKCVDYIGQRKSICSTRDEEVAMVLPYNTTTGVSGPIASQLIVGNNVVIRPSSTSVESYRILESVWKRVYPEKVRVEYTKAKEFMTWAIQEPNVKVIILFGHDSMAMGYKEAVQRAGKKFMFEGPGKNPAIVLEDADPKAAAEDLFNLRFGMNSGQVCISPGRFYVHEDIFEQFLDTLIQATKRLVVGDPRDPQTEIGPIGSEAAVRYIEEQFKDAWAKGAKTAQGGRIEGRLVHPTIWVNVDHNMLGMHNESFGPVIWIMPFRTVEEAISLAKDNKYGLGASIFGKKDAAKVQSALKGEEYLHEVEDFVFGKFGTVVVNTHLGEGLFRMLGGLLGGYGYSGWVWETENGKFKLKQGIKALALETSVKME